MLGHIAITAMGGCFSQNPDTGAAEATYFPAESVVLSGNCQFKLSRPANTTDFNRGFTQTAFWTKVQRFGEIRPSSWPNFFTLGTDRYVSGGAPRCWTMCCCAPNAGGHVSLYENETEKILSLTVNPTKIWTCTKEAGSNVSKMTDGLITGTATTVKVEDALKNRDFHFMSGPTERTSEIRFFGDYMSNKPYNLHFRRLPMQCAENNAVALYEVDSQQFIEY